MIFAQSALLLPHTDVSYTFSVVPSPSMLIPATALIITFRIIFIYFITYFLLFMNTCEQTMTENMIEKMLVHQ